MNKIYKFLTRNNFNINGQRINKNRVNLEWWSEQTNVGDYLSLIIYQWMLKKKNISVNQKVSKSYHFLGIGSIIGMNNYDAVIWGSGIHTLESAEDIMKRRRYVKYDIRAVRGPLTKKILTKAGYKCPNIYGDPAILMPFVYKKKNVKKTYDITLIEHLNNMSQVSYDNLNFLNIMTHDYKQVIDTIQSSKKIISSSLHGIILAESYGVPAVFLNKGVENEIIKYIDWYFSTNRTNIKIASSISEAITMQPMKLPNLENMQNNLIDTFPYDLWDY